MPLYQNTSVDATKLIIGNYKIEVAPYGTTAGAASWVNLGAGIVNKFGHNYEKYKAQAGNAPDPVEGVATETFIIDGELIEYDASVLSALSGGVTTKSTGASGVTVLSGGGVSTVTYKTFKLTNTRMQAASAAATPVTHQTVVLVFKASLDNGLQFTSKSDNDTDPVNVMPFSITGKVDSTLSAGAQLYTITRTYNA